MSGRLPLTAADELDGRRNPLLGLPHTETTYQDTEDTDDHCHPYRGMEIQSGDDDEPIKKRYQSEPYPLQAAQSRAPVHLLAHEQHQQNPSRQHQGEQGQRQCLAESRAGEVHEIQDRDRVGMVGQDSWPTTPFGP